MIKGNGHWYRGSNMLPSIRFSFHDLINKLNDNSIKKMISNVYVHITTFNIY